MLYRINALRNFAVFTGKQLNWRPSSLVRWSKLAILLRKVPIKLSYFYNSP